MPQKRIEKEMKPYAKPEMSSLSEEEILSDLAPAQTSYPLNNDQVGP